MNKLEIKVIENRPFYKDYKADYLEWNEGKAISILDYGIKKELMEELEKDEEFITNALNLNETPLILFEKTFNENEKIKIFLYPKRKAILIRIGCLLISLKSIKKLRLKDFETIAQLTHAKKQEVKRRAKFAYKVLKPIIGL